MDADERRRELEEKRRKLKALDSGLIGTAKDVSPPPRISVPLTAAAPTETPQGEVNSELAAILAQFSGFAGALSS